MQIKIKVGIASDHAGYNLKSEIINHFPNDQFQFIDYGCDNGKDSVDYPDIAQNLCQKYLKKEFELGILICGSGIGVSIAANRFKEIRAALCHNVETATLARQHNDSNILCLGARILENSEIFKIIQAFLTTEFAGGRHKLRVEKLSNN